MSLFLLGKSLFDYDTVALGNSQVSLPHIMLVFSHVSGLSFTIPPYKLLSDSGTIALGTSQVPLPHIIADFSHVRTLSVTVPS